MSRWSRARDHAAAIAGWPALTTAIAIDRGYVEQWPFELTRTGRRSCQPIGIGCSPLLTAQTIETK
jgi:hypothetical protein